MGQEGRDGIRDRLLRREWPWRQYGKRNSHFELAVLNGTVGAPQLNLSSTAGTRSMKSASFIARSRLSAATHTRLCTEHPLWQHDRVSMPYLAA